MDQKSFNKPSLILLAFLFAMNLVMIVTDIRSEFKRIEIAFLDRNNKAESKAVINSNNMTIENANILVINNPTILQSFMYDKSINNPLKSVFKCVVIVFAFVLINKIRRNGFYKTDLHKALNGIATTICIYVILIICQNFAIDSLIRSTCNNSFSLNTVDDFDMFFYLALSIIYFANSHKKNTELTEQQDLTI